MKLNREWDNEINMEFINNIVQILGKFLGVIFYTIDFRHRRVTIRNLSFAYPDWSEERIKSVSRKVFMHIGVTFLEIFQMGFLDREKTLQKVMIKNNHYMDAAIKKNNPVIMISAHIGNWEMAHVFTSAYLNTPIVLVARALDNKILDNWINKIRTKFGNQVWHKKGALSKLARSLRDGNIVGMLIDQETRDNVSVQINFFNRVANATPAAALLARRYDATVLPVFCIRGANNKLILDVQKPVEIIHTKDRNNDIKINTQRMTNAVEQIIRIYPDQWFWVHKRWKRHYPELYPEDMARHERQKEKKRRRKKAMEKELQNQ